MANRLTTNTKLLIVLGVLVVAAAVKAFVGKSSFDTGESAQAAETLFPNLAKDDLTAFLIEAPEGKKHELARDGDHWNVVSDGNARADQADVNKVLDAVTKLKKGKVISSTGDNPARYGLDDAKATKVTVWGKAGRAGAPAAVFVLGKIQDDWKNAFLKLVSDSSIRSPIRKVEASVDSFDPGTDNTWRDKTMFDHGAADKIAQIEITGPKGTLVLAREKIMGPKAEPDAAHADPAAPPDHPESATPPDPTAAGAKPGEQEVKETVWNLVAPNPGRAKKWLCDSLAGYVAKLECDSFGSDGDKAADLGLDPPQYTIRVKREDDSEPKTILLVGNKSKDGKYAVKLPDAAQPQIWWIAGWKGDYLTKSAEELSEAPPAKPDASEDPAAGKGDAATPPAPADGAAPNDGAAAPGDGAAPAEKPSSGGGE